MKMNLQEAAHTLKIETPCDERVCTGISIDSRTIEKGDLFLAICGERFDGHRFVAEAAAKGAAAVVVQESVQAACPIFQVEDTRLALAQIAGAWRNQFDIPVVALTGSCGKTTVKEMVAAILRLSGDTLATHKNLNNELGVPLTLCQIEKTHRYAVIELGASKKGDIDYLMPFVAPTIALVTNAAAAHLAGFGSLEGVAETKGEIYHQLPEKGIAIVNGDDPFSQYWLSVNRAFDSHRRVVVFGLMPGADITAADLHPHQDGCYTFNLVLTPGLFEKENSPVPPFEEGGLGGILQAKITLSLPGHHNVVNALAAAAVGVVCGLPLSLIQEGLAQVKPVAGRLCLLKTPEGARLIDDTYNANPASVRAAMHFLVSHPGEKILVLGDLAELGDEAEKIHTELGQEAHRLGISQLYTLGALSQFASRAFSGARHFTKLDALIAALKKQITPHAAILVKGSRVSGMERVVKALELG